jgi:CubicO group peptidase (beta-lactamase class C family)
MDDAFHIGSCTKTVTAMLVASLVEEGRLSWEDTIAEHFGDFPEIHPAYRSVTLADVARHRAGLVGHSADIAEAIERYAELPGSPTEQRAMYLRDVLRAEPEETLEQTHYSNAGFCLLAHVCERVLGESYEDLVESRVLAPAGVLRAMFGWPATPDRPHGVWGHSVEDGVVTPFDGDPRLGAFLAPAGDLALSIDDFARVIRQHLLGPEGESPVASAEGFREMHRRVGGTYGAGIGMAERRGITHLGHAGSTGVHWARYRIWPEFGVAAVMAVNGPVDPVAERTVDAAFDAVVAEWQ